MDKNRVILDVDAGVDDAMAIILAMHSPELEVVAITTVSGNTHVDNCTKNVLRVLALLQGDKPPIVARGEERPLKKEPHLATSVHGHDGLGDLGDDYYPPLNWDLVSSKPAVEVVPELLKRESGQITVVATGPLTNIARAIETAPTAMAQAKEIVIMGGAVNQSGNIPPLGVAEFNIYVDPDALEVVLGFTVPVTLVPLDVTHKVRLMRRRAHKELATPSGAVPRFVVHCSKKYMDFHRDEGGFDGAYLHDPLAVGVVIDPSLVKTEPMHLY
ncbi:MAG: nucleoside hydrolase, partial [Dehalococcoidia bacterium]